MSGRMPGQVIEMTLSGFGICTQCGTEIAEGALIGYWHSGAGKSFDRIVSCPTCRRPTALLKERQWLLEQLEHLAGARGAYSPSVQQPMPQHEVANAVAYLNSELDSNWRRTNVVLIKLMHKLPRCEECTEFASHQIRNGPYYCGAHSAEHPTAQRVEWVTELEELGIG